VVTQLKRITELD